MSTTLYGWGPMFGLPGASPFVMKTDIQLQLLGVTFERAIANLDSVKKHKAPYVMHEGQVVEDSTFIRDYFEKKLGRDLDQGLNAEQRGVAWATERMLEDRLVFVVSHERWMEDDNFQRGPAQFFAGVPEAMRAQVIRETRDSMRAMLVRHGIGRHSREERMWLASRDIAAVAAVLGDKPFMFGSAPTALDASAFGILTSCATRFFDSPLPDLVARHDNLAPYLARIESRYMHPEQWPALNAGVSS